MEDLEDVQAQMVAFIMGVSNSSAHVGILIELGWPSIKGRIYERKLKYYHRLRNIENDMLVKKVFNECLEADVFPQDSLVGNNYKKN